MQRTIQGYKGAQKSMTMISLRYCSYSPREMLCNECVIIENVEFDSFLPPFTLLCHGERYKIMSENCEVQ
jgi:hypothetical protein